MNDNDKTKAQLVEELETLRRQQRALLDITSDAIITTDLDFVIQGTLRRLGLLLGRVEC